MNGDGRLDAVASLRPVGVPNSNSVCVLTNRGNGLLAVSQYCEDRISDAHYSLALVDFNGTSGPDLAVLNYNAQSVTIRLNIGNGSFGSATEYPVDMQPHSVASGDFNGDGRVDLIVRGNAFSRVLLGRGDGSFTVATILLPSIASGTIINPGTMAVGDFDANGTPDLALTAYNNAAVAVQLNHTPPFLEITRAVGYNQISWLASFSAGFSLEYTTNGIAPGNWQPFPSPPVVLGNQKGITDWTDHEQKFYRLKKP